MNDQKSPPDLNKIGFFIELPPKRREFLLSKLKKQDFSAGEDIIRAGRSGYFLGIIENGEITLKNGADLPLTATSGQIFGSEMLLEGKPSQFTISARTDTTIWILDRKDWQAPSPSKSLKSISTEFIQLNKKAWITLVAVLTLLVVALTLGPTLFERANNTLPGRFVENGRYDLAERYLDYAVRLKPESADLYGKLGDIHALQGKNGEAIEAYEQALILDDYLPWIHNNLGVILLEEGQIDLSLEEFKAAIELNPIHTAAYRNLGIAYYSQEKWGKAAEAFQKALEIDFTLMEAKAAWAGLILNESRLVEARLVWEDVLLADPRHPLALQGLGVVSLLEDDPALAMLYFDAAKYLAPDDIAMHLYIGMALEALAKPAEAAVEYQIVIDQGSDPDLISLADTLLEILLE